MKHKFIHIGGLVAVGFDKTGKYILAVSHSGRGIYELSTWQRVARDASLAYPVNRTAIGIGPIDGQVISVEQRDETRDTFRLATPDNCHSLLVESDGITVMGNTLTAT